MPRLLGSALMRLLESPGAWFTNFVDSAEEWVSDPLLADDESY